jgi:hypothetical protein
MGQCSVCGAETGPGTNRCELHPFQGTFSERASEVESPRIERSASVGSEVGYSRSLPAPVAARRGCAVLALVVAAAAAVGTILALLR